MRVDCYAVYWLSVHKRTQYKLCLWGLPAIDSRCPCWPNLYTYIGSTSRVCWEACILPNTRHWSNASSILVHHLLRWPNIKSALCERSVLAGYDTRLPVYMYLIQDTLSCRKCVSPSTVPHTCWRLSTILYTPLYLRPIQFCDFPDWAFYRWYWR